MHTIFQSLLQKKIQLECQTILKNHNNCLSANNLFSTKQKRTKKDINIKISFDEYAFNRTTILKFFEVNLHQNLILNDHNNVVEQHFPTFLVRRTTKNF